MPSSDAIRTAAAEQRAAAQRLSGLDVDEADALVRALRTMAVRLRADAARLESAATLIELRSGTR